MIISADSNIFLYAANLDSPHHPNALDFFATAGAGRQRFIVCGLVLIEIYMQLRNPAIFKQPRSPKQAAAFCQILRTNPAWEYVDYEPDVAKPMWQWAASTSSGFRHIIDARLAFTLAHHGVTHFATANVKHFGGFGFVKVWNPTR